MTTERIAPEHLRELQLERANSLQDDAMETQQMNLSHIASKLSFELRPGLSVGEYIVEEKLGEGGMGEVWRARQPMIDKQVALKVLGQDVIANKSSLSRFLQEARAVNQIKHRNLVDIFSFGELPDGRPYFVMEYLEGNDLGQHLERNGVLAFSEILLIFDQVCRALQAAHDRNIIHRDLKPDNIFLIIEPNQPPFVKVLDFGIAKLSTSDGKGLTQTNAVFGTPGYMAPEQCEGAKNVDHRADVYALAVILFEVITGQTPFSQPGESAFAIVARQMTTEPPNASDKLPSRRIPASVDAFLRKALSRKRENRPQSCTEFYQQLVAAVGDKKSETRAQMQAEPTTSIDINITPSEDDRLGNKRLAPRSQLEGLVGEVVGLKAPPKKEKKKLGVMVGACVASVMVGVLAVFLWPSEAPTVTAHTSISNPEPMTVPAPQTEPASQPASLSVPPPLEPVIIPEPKKIKKDPKKTAKDKNNEPPKCTGDCVVNPFKAF
jgi:serine/threonine protein kinase